MTINGTGSYIIPNTDELFLRGKASENGMDLLEEAVCDLNEATLDLEEGVYNETYPDKLEALTPLFKDLFTRTDNDFSDDLDLIISAVDDALTVLGPYIAVYERADVLAQIRQVLSKWKVTEETLPEKAVAFLKRIDQFKAPQLSRNQKNKWLGNTVLQKKSNEMAKTGMSAGAKRAWNFLFSALQLTSEMIQFSKKSGVREMEESISKSPFASTKRQAKCEAFVGKVLGEKLKDLRSMSDEMFLKFTRSFPETREYLDGFRRGSQEVVFKRGGKSVNWASGTQISVSEAMKQYRVTAALKARRGGTVSAEEETDRTRKAVINSSETMVNSPSPLAPLRKDLEELQRRATLQHDYQPKHDQPCYALETLEEQLKRSMQTARTELLPPQETLNQYGPKHHNLVKMDRVTQALEIDHLIIPAPQGISSEQVRQFLPEKVFTHWEKLKKLKQNDNGQVAFFSQAEPQQLLQEIDQAIEETFNAEDAWEKLALPDGAKEWFTEMVDGGHFLMVRSTGAEDSSKIANAGGNESCAYVPATPTDLCVAIGRVVRSYFSRNSLQIRLSGGANPFEEELKLAVTTQQLIGEPVGGSSHPHEIPVSFVLFTNEPLYINGEKFRAMRLSATYGHGEAVVKNMGIPTDSVLILHSEAQPDQLFYIYANQHKPNRLAPQRNEQGKVTLEPMANPKELQNVPSLSEKQILNLYRSGVLMEAFFDDHPTDIEGVVKGEDVYFVQARPVNRKPQLPTYLAVAERASQKIIAESLVAGSASVVKVQSADEVIVAATLHEAEEIFGAKDRASQEKVKLVIVSEPEPENSHSVVNFSGLMMPCLLVHDLAQVHSLLSLPKKTLVACMQTATLYTWDVWDEKDHVKEGFAVHPAKVAISLSTPFSSTDSPPANLEIVSLLKQVREGSLDALNQLETHPQLLYLRAKNHYFANKKGPAAAKQRIAILQELDGQIRRSIAEMRAVIPQGERVHTLLHAKILETLCARNMPGLGRYSLPHVEMLAKEIDEILAYQSELPFPAEAADLFLAGKVNAEALPQWKQFLIHVEKLLHQGQISSAEWHQFCTLMGTFQETGTWPLWLTFFQEQAQSSWFRSTSSLQLARFKNILAQTAPAELQQMHEQMQLQKTIHQLQLQKELFADEKTLSVARLNLQKQIDHFSNPERLDQIKTSSPLTRSIAYKTMEKLVDLIDQSIKVVKMSQVKGRVKIVKEMLSPFFSLMRIWVEKMVPPNSIPLHEAWPLKDYLEQMRALLEAMPDEGTEQFLPSPGNSVSAAMLGAGTAFERHFPQRLEDMLTLIHQNALVALNALNQELLPSEQIYQSLLPEAVKNAMARIEHGEGNITFQRMGIEISSKEVLIHYNVPLRNHSGHIELRCDLATGKMTFIAKLLGQARTRWGETTYWIHALEAAGVVTSDKPLFQNQQELSWSWTLQPENLEIALSEYAAMAKYSLEGTSLSEHLQALYDSFGSQPAIQYRLRSYFLSNLVTDMGTERNLYAHLAEAAQEEEVPLFIELAKSSFLGEHWMMNELGLNVFRGLLAKKRGAEVALPLALASWHQENRIETNLELFAILFKNGYGVEEAIAELKNESTDYRAKKELAKILIAQGLAYEAVIQLAEKASNDLDLWKALIEKGQGIEEATHLAKQQMDEQGKEGAAIQLYLYLAKEFRLDLSEGLSAYKRGMKIDPIQSSKLLIHLIRQGAETESALEALKQPLPLKDKLNLVVELARRGVTTDAYASVLNEAQEQLSYEEGEIVWKLLNIMTNNGLEPAVCLREATRRLKDSPLDLELALFIIRNWVNQGQGYREAESVLDVIINQPASPYDSDQLAALELAKALVEKGHSYDIAFNLLEKSFDPRILKASFSVAEALLDKGEKVKELTQLVWSLTSSHPKESDKLFNLLLDKGYGESMLSILWQSAEGALSSLLDFAQTCLIWIQKPR